MKKLIGLDFGTDSVRAILATCEGELLASEVAEYPRWAEGRFCEPARHRFRHHPLDYLECMERALRRALEGQDASQVAGIAVDTTGSTPCAVNSAGVPLALLPEFAENPNAMFVLWKDHTAIQEAERINEVASRWPVDYRKYAGGIYSSEWFWSKILHVLREDAAVRKAAFSWVELCDWVVGELSGRNHPLEMRRSRCAAGHKALWHPSWGGLPSAEFLHALDPLLDGLRGHLYQDTCTADHPCGRLAPKWAARLGLPETVVVGGASLDCHCGAVGAGIQPNEMVKVMGTSTCDILIAPRVDACVHGICGQVDGSVVPGFTGLEAGQAAFGDVFAWFKRLLSWAGPVELPALEREAQAIPPGSTGLLALDWFNGRRSPDENTRLAGGVLGLHLGSTAPMVYRALVEATVFGSRAIIERYREEGIAVKAVSAVGGISRKSPFVMQMCADVLGMPVRVAATPQACALGAAMFAATAAGLFPDVPAAMARMGAGFDVVYHPNQKLAGIYDALYRKYRQLGRLAEQML